MASTLCCRTSSSLSIVSASGLRRRLPLVGAFCVLSFGLSNLCLSYNSPLKTGCAQSLPFANLLRSKFSGQSPAKGVHTFRMEGSSNTVPSIVVYVTVPNKELGKKLAESIVREKLAACVNRVPVDTLMRNWHQVDYPGLGSGGIRVELDWGIESVYEWKGEIQTDNEELLIIKTRQSLLQDLTEHVKANHEYDVPEVIALPITGGSLQYLEWIKNSTRD